MNKADFYKSLKRRNSGIFGTSLSQRQVDGIEALLRQADGLSVPHLAHCMGETYHETGGGMYPVKETVYSYSRDKNPSDATVIKRLDAAWAKGQLSWVKTPYWRGGMFGRGGIQITHYDNYLKMSPIVGINLVDDPSAALLPDVSAKITVQGCKRGMFRGSKLSDFDKPGGGYDHDRARNIVNGDRKKRLSGSNRTIGQAISDYSKAFEVALIAAGYRAEPVRPDVEPPVAPPPAPPSPPKSSGALAKLLAAIVAFFKSRSAK